MAHALTAPTPRAGAGQPGLPLAHTGRNRIYEQEAGGASRPLYGHPLAHAEVNALLALDYASVDVRSCVLYATTEPCPLCTGALLMAGVDLAWLNQGGLPRRSSAVVIAPFAGSRARLLAAVLPPPHGLE